MLNAFCTVLPLFETSLAVRAWLNEYLNTFKIVLIIVGRFCMKLWKKLVKVHGDLQTLSRTLHEYNFVSRSVEYLIEALQEQVTIV